MLGNTASLTRGYENGYKQNLYFLLVARVLLGVALFTQVAQAAQACVMSYKLGAALSTEPMPDNCDPSLSKNKNNCLAQYVQGDQVVDRFHAWGFDAQDRTTPVVPPIEISLLQARHFLLASTPPPFTRPIYLQFLRLLN